MRVYKDIVKKIPIPANDKTKQKEYLETGILPIIDQGQGLIGGYSDELGKRIHCDLPVIIFGDHTKCVKYVDFPFGAGADGIKILQPREDVLPKYLYYGTKYLTFRMSDKGYARHYQHIEKMELAVPAIIEQERIVAKIEEMFSELDKAVETLQTIKQQLNVYRQAVLQEAFSGRLTKSWRKNNITISATKVKEIIAKRNKVIGYRPMMENLPLSDIPETWQWVSVGDISTGAEYGTSQKSLKFGKVPVLRMGNMKNGKLHWDDLVYSDDEVEIEKYLLKKGDVLFNRTNSAEHVGKTSAFMDERKALFAGYIIRVNQVQQVDSLYLTYFMNSSIARSYANKVKTDGVNQSNINIKKLYSYPFPLCDLEEQKQVVHEIEARLSVCDNIEQIVDETIVWAEAMRQSIMKEAFEGRLL